MKRDRSCRRTYSYSIAAFTAVAIGGAAEARADEVILSPVESATTTTTTTVAANPNLKEWSLINLQAADVASANSGAAVKVAVIDGKADCRNSALAGRCTSYGLANGTYTTYAAHATHTSGIVGASAYGIAPMANILNYAAFADNGYVAYGNGLSDIWKSAYLSGASIASMSFNCAGTALCFSGTELSTVANAAMPMLYVHAAGNDGKAVGSEWSGLNSALAAQALNRILIVGSVNANGVISTFSNRPGTGCLLATTANGCTTNMMWQYHFLVAPGEAIYSSLPNNSFGYMSGTSMATPVVAGAAALLEARWPALKTAPEKVARILLTTATDLGAPGVDPVYGYGLLNVAAAFRANGTVSLVNAVGAATVVTSSKITTSSALSKLSSILGNVTVYDSYGRDYRLAETGQLAGSLNVQAMHQQLGLRLLGASRQEDWVNSFFGESKEPKSFAYYGSGGGQQPVAGLTQDRSMRAGVDVPFKGGVAAVRLTGAGDARTDFAFDPSLRPLAYFASTSLVQGALVSSVQLRLSPTSRLMTYGIATTGAVNPQYSNDPHDLMITEKGYAPRSTLTGQSVQNSKVGVGVGYWSLLGDKTVVGVNASVVTQRNGYFTMTSDLADFNRPTQMYNLGAAASRRLGSWELSLSGEVTHMRMSGQGALGFTPATMASGEAAISKSGLALHGKQVTDRFNLSFLVPPRAVAGDLRLNYMAPTADGMGQQAVDRRVPISQLGHDPMRVEAAYQVRNGNRWSLSLSGGYNLEKATGLGRAEGMATFRLSL